VGPLADGLYTPCSAPRKDYANVGLGTHTFKLVAKDTVNNTAPAREWTWKVVSDNDGDGINLPEDCDDANAGIRPGAVEIPENGIDENCDGADGANLDRDGDGIQRPADCDDNNATIRPGAVDTPEDGLDQDCASGDARTMTKIWRLTSRARQEGRLV
jgi:hypothetical protein